MAGEAASGEPSPPMPARSSAWGIYETFETADESRLFIGITSDPHWRAFCDAFHKADWFADPRFRTNADRVNNRDQLRALVADVARTHSRDELAGIFEKARIPFAPVNTPSDLFNDPQMLVHALPTRMPSGKIANLPPLPIAINDETLGLRLQPPAAGEHTDEILAALGYPQDRIAALRTAGVIA